mgnify:FL=1
MTGANSVQQFARVLDHVLGNSARAHAANMLASKPKEERERLDEQWNNTLFDGGLNWTITWKEGNLK